MVEKTKILIIGASGLLGSAFLKKFSEKYETYGTYCNNKFDKGLYYDFTKNDLSIFKKIKPNIVIHSGGITDVDLCEIKKELAYSVNVEGTKNIIEGCRLNDSKLIYISTDFVFDGEKGNYKEDDIPNPINHYAKTKLESENLIKNSGLKYLIIRVSFLYDTKDNKKFIHFVINKLKNNEEVNAIVDHIRTPTLVEDIAYTLEALIRKNRTGIYHVSGSEVLSNYETALKIADVFNFNKKLVKPIYAKDFKQTALRPRNTSLNTEKLKKENIVMSNLTEGLKKI